MMLFPIQKRRRLVKRLDMHHTPKHGSWLNIAKIQISILARQCLCRLIPSLSELNLDLDAWASSKADRVRLIGNSLPMTPVSNSNIYILNFVLVNY